MSAKVSKIFLGRIPKDTREKDVRKFFSGYDSLGEIFMRPGHAIVEFESRDDAEEACVRLHERNFNGYRCVVTPAKERLIDKRSNENWFHREDAESIHSGSNSYGWEREETYNSRSSRFPREDSDQIHYRKRVSREDSDQVDSRRRVPQEESDQVDSRRRVPTRDVSRGRERDPPFPRLGQRGPFNTQHRVLVSNLHSTTSWREMKDLFRTVGIVTFADAHRFKGGEGVVDFVDESSVEAAVKEIHGKELDGKIIRVTRDSPRDPEEDKRSRSRSSSIRTSSRRRS